MSSPWCVSLWWDVGSDVIPGGNSASGPACKCLSSPGWTCRSPSSMSSLIHLFIHSTRRKAWRTACSCVSPELGAGVPKTIRAVVEEGGAE